jgi:hypothetical protein
MIDISITSSIDYIQIQTFGYRDLSYGGYFIGSTDHNIL